MGGGHLGRGGSVDKSIIILHVKTNSHSHQLSIKPKTPGNLTFTSAPNKWKKIIQIKIHQTNSSLTLITVSCWVGVCNIDVS